MAALLLPTVVPASADAEELRPSGVHRTARDAREEDDEASDQKPPSQRPTRPSAPRSIRPATHDVYQQIEKGPLASLESPERRRKPWSARAITRDLLQRLGSFDQIPRRVPGTSVYNLRLRPRHAFILHLVDGSLSIASIVDASPLPMDEVMELLTDLVSHGLVTLT